MVMDIPYSQGGAGGCVLMVITVSGDLVHTGFLLQQVKCEQTSRLIFPSCSSERAWLVPEHHVPGVLANNFCDLLRVTQKGCGRRKRRRDIFHCRKTVWLPLGRMQDGFVPPRLCSDVRNPLTTAAKAPEYSPSPRARPSIPGVKSK